MRLHAVSAVALLLGIVLSRPASAGVITFSFAGGGIIGNATLSYGPDPVAGDPPGAMAITAASGRFSDSTLGLSQQAIVGVAPLNIAAPSPTNLLAPKSFSYYDIANGVSSPEGHVAGFTFDNLFYPAGSPQTATDYTFSGGFLDIYGLVFVLNNGDGVNFWSDGVVPGAGLSYGAGVTDGVNPIGYVFSGISVNIPEPDAATLLAAGLGALSILAVRRRHQRR